MTVVITPSPLSGTVRAPSSKSHLHRLLFCAALASEPTVIQCGALSEDVLATVSCLRGLGCSIEFLGSAIRVSPQSLHGGCALDCGESGTTARFLLPVVCALGVQCELILRGRLPQRPFDPLFEALRSGGCAVGFSQSGRIASSGRLKSGEYRISGSVSSQFVSGLLLALPLLRGDSRIVLDGELESLDYVNMTRAVQRLFSVRSDFDGHIFAVRGGQRYVSPDTVTAEGDWSAAAFWLCANSLCGGVSCTGLEARTEQGDSAAASLFGAIVRGGAVIDAKNIPDLVPILSVAAAVSSGVTEIRGAGRLRLKESDRLRSVSLMLSALGGEVRELDDALIITGRPRLRGGVVDSFGDHRIAMSAAVASTVCTEPVTVLGAQSVAKSYPDFWRDFTALGGKIKILDE